MKYLIFLMLTAAGVFAGCNSKDPLEVDCGANPLTVPFIEAGVLSGTLSQMQPLGNIFGPHLIPTAHFYLDLIREVPGDSSSHSVPTVILSPGHARLVAVQPHSDSDLPGTSVQAYKVTLKICKNTYIYIDHLNQLGSKFPAKQWANLNSGLTLEPGDVLGTTTSTHAIDVGAFDTTYSAPFIRPDFYNPAYASETEKVTRPSLSFKKCALDYFTAEAQNVLYAKNPRMITPRCGDFAQDIAGRAQGTWFSTSLYGFLPRMIGVQSEEPATISLTHDSVDPTALAFSFGDGVPVTDANGETLSTPSTVPMFTKYYYTQANDPASAASLENTAFADIKLGNEVHCIRDLKDGPWSGATPISNRIMLVQMRVDGPGDLHPGKTILRVQARDRADCPPVDARHLNNGFAAEYFRD